MKNLACFWFSFSRLCTLFHGPVRPLINRGVNDLSSLPLLVVLPLFGFPQEKLSPTSFLSLLALADLFLFSADDLNCSMGRWCV